MISPVSVPFLLKGKGAERTDPDPEYLRGSYGAQRRFSAGQGLRMSGSASDLEGALAGFQKLAALHLRHLRFTIREEAGLVQVVVTESNGEDKIIRKIPSDEIVRMIERRNEILGFLFDRVI